VPTDDPRFVPGEHEAAPDEGERRLASFGEVAGQAQTEGGDAVVSDAPGGVQQSRTAKGGDGLRGEDPLREDEVVRAR